MKPSQVFTLSERIEIYQDMLNYLKSPGLKRSCFCLMLYNNPMKNEILISKTLLWLDLLPVHLLKFFPELLKFKPEPTTRYSPYWFPTSDFHSRIAVLSNILNTYSPSRISDH